MYCKLLTVVLLLWSNYEYSAAASSTTSDFTTMSDFTTTSDNVTASNITSENSTATPSTTGHIIPVGNSSTEPPQTDVTDAAVDLSSYTVVVKIYLLKVDKFDEEEYSKLLATKATQYCKGGNHTQCLLSSDSVTFEPSDVIVSYEEDNSKDLKVLTAVQHPRGSNNTALPKSVLAQILIQNRKEFRDVIGRDIIGVNGQVFNITADVTNNIIICIVFVILTLILLIVVLLLRKDHNERENDDRKQLAAIQMKRKEMNSEVYKIRPGPEPIDRCESLKRRPSEARAAQNRVTPSSVKLKPSALNGDDRSPPTTAAQMNSYAMHRMAPNYDQSQETSRNRDEEAGYGRPHVDPEYSASKLPPLGEPSEPPKREKKKKKKKRKHREPEGSEVGEEENSGYNNATYNY